MWVISIFLGPYISLICCSFPTSLMHHGSPTLPWEDTIWHQPIDIDLTSFIRLDSNIFTTMCCNKHGPRLRYGGSLTLGTSSDHSRHLLHLHSTFLDFQQSFILPPLCSNYNYMEKSLWWQFHKRPLFSSISWFILFFPLATSYYSRNFWAMHNTHLMHSSTHSSRERSSSTLARNTLLLCGCILKLGGNWGCFKTKQRKWYE